MTIRTLLRTRASVMLAGLMLFCCAIGPPGCSTEEVQAKRDAAAAEKAKLDAQVIEQQRAQAELADALRALQSERAQVLALIDQSQQGSAARAAAEAALAVVVAKITQVGETTSAVNAAIAAASQRSQLLGERVATADKLIAQANSPDPAMQGLMGLVSTWWPGFGTAGAGLAMLGWKTLRLARANAVLRDDGQTANDALARVIGSIEALASVAPEVAAALQKHKVLMDTVQTPLGKSAVDSVQETLRVAA